ncbi:NAD-dependent epimerase/dehydratase family protein [Sabulilitoribacter multivorans]|uniref:NAD-dependent epimerase/dehydratase family protein n=1 Tax=Flaviramulus multivorans TaxID=1304750 RepID=A0ABS9IHT0_9FLAO|nr:NAD-dependent epimerase/dehydratase family protein [Flaviramulus multivorans]MCF7560327.1 NAD-dependent epimerase/dehydratase family protein [Flaviramulus multivorans]
MKILIIGSKGFIGSHCYDHFKKEHEVWQCDVVTDYVSNNYYLVDATNADFNWIFESNKFDICINCSGAASVPNSIKNPQRDFTLNVINVYKQLDAIRKYNPNCRYLNFSSAAVYGNPESLPIHEIAKTNPISPYGYHKKMAEDICHAFYSNYGVLSCSLRVFSAYGVGLQKQLFWDLNQKTLKTNKVELFGTGKESRDFIHIADVLQAIDCVILKSDFKADVINIASGKELFINDVVKIFYAFLDKEINYKFLGKERLGDPSNWKADISKIESYGFKPKVDIYEGLKGYVKWLNESA